MNDIQQAAFDAEKDLMGWDKWTMDELPEAARPIVEELQNDRIPTGVGRNEKYGWFVLVSAGQGPCFAYREKNDE